jgi:hypothetical protein
VKKSLDDLVERKGETYNDIIKRLVKSYKDRQKGSSTPDR